MPDYRRNRVPGGTFFFTVNVLDRRSDLLVTQIPVLRDAVRQVRRHALPHRRLGRPSRPYALAVDLTGRRCRLPRSLARDQDGFSKALPARESRSPAMTSRGERGIWQRRYWEHTIRDDRDFAAHLDYTHFNPVKHGLVKHPADWPHSSFRQCVAKGRGQGALSGRMDRRQRRATRDGRAALSEVAECAPSRLRGS